MQKRTMLLSTLSLVLLATNCQTKLFSLHTTSPNNTYTVNLIEQINPPGELYNYMVGLTMFKGNQLIVDYPRFSGRDGFDRRFGDEYPESFWLAENLLRLGSNPIYPAEHCDQIFVRNETSKLISYFMVRAKSEMFLILELNPQSAVKLYAQPQADQGADISWIGYAGQFNDNIPISSGGMSFRIPRKYVRAAHYCIKIGDEAVTITSSDFEGIKISSGTEITTPKATDCGK